MILQGLKNSGYSVIGLSDELGVNRSAVYQSINGAGSRSIRIKIALIMNKKPSELWRKNDRVTRACDDLCYYELKKINCTIKTVRGKQNDL